MHIVRDIIDVVPLMHTFGRRLIRWWEISSRGVGWSHTSGRPRNRTEGEGVHHSAADCTSAKRRVPRLFFVDRAAGVAGFDWAADATKIDVRPADGRRNRLLVGRHIGATETSESHLQEGTGLSTETGRNVLLMWFEEARKSSDA